MLVKNLLHPKEFLKTYCQLSSHSLVAVIGLFFIGCSSKLAVEVKSGAPVSCEANPETEECSQGTSHQKKNLSRILFNPDTIKTDEDSFEIAWDSMPNEGVKALTLVLAIDKSCEKVMVTKTLEPIESSTLIANLQDNIYYACIYAQNADGSLSPGENNGIKILVDREPPVVTMKKSLLLNIGKSFNPGVQVTDLSDVQYEWKVHEGSTKIDLDNPYELIPRIRKDIEGAFVFELTVTDELGHATVKTVKSGKEREHNCSPSSPQKPAGGFPARASSSHGLQHSHLCHLLE